MLFMVADSRLIIFIPVHPKTALKLLKQRPTVLYLINHMQLFLYNKLGHTFCT